MLQAVLKGPRDLEVVEVDRPYRDDGEALVRLRWGGICGTDLAAYRGISPQVSYPRVPGHELLVDVVAATPDELIGQRAVVDPTFACGACRPCKSGRPNSCVSLRVMGAQRDGGLQEEFVVPVDRLYQVPHSVSDDLAVLAEPVAVAYHAVERAQMNSGEQAVVFGAGPIGLLIGRLLTAVNGCRVHIVDIDSARLDQARRLGLTPIHSPQDDVEEVMRSATSGRGARVVFEATGSRDCIRLMTEVLASNGRVVVVGWPHEPVSVNLISLIRKEGEIVATRNSTNAFPRVLQIMEDHLVDDLTTTISHRFTLATADEAFRTIADPAQGAVKVLIAGDPSLLDSVRSKGPTQLAVNP